MLWSLHMLPFALCVCVSRSVCDPWTSGTQFEFNSHYLLSAQCELGKGAPSSSRWRFTPGHEACGMQAASQIPFPPELGPQEGTSCAAREVVLLLFTSTCWVVLLGLLFLSAIYCFENKIYVWSPHDLSPTVSPMPRFRRPGVHS